MVGSEDIGKSLESSRSAGVSASDAAQALTAILQTQYLRYIIIGSWAIGLLGTVGWVEAIVWFTGTVGAGAIRSKFEKSMAGRVDAGWGLLFPAVATITTAAWASAPLMLGSPAIRSDTPWPWLFWSAAMCSSSPSLEVRRNRRS